MDLLLQTIHRMDLQVYHFLSGFAGNWLLDRLASQEEGNHLLKGGIFFAMYWYLWFRNGTDRQSRRNAIIRIVIGAMLAIIVARSMAFIAPFRLRPMHDPALTHPSYSVSFAYNLENWSAFPSDTAAYFFALAFGLAHLLRRLAIPIVLYTAGWVCLPRIYLGLHHASDIVVGISIGIAMAWVSLRSSRLQSLVVSRMLTAMERKPEWFYAIAFIVCFEMATVFTEARLAGKALLHAVLVGLNRGSVTGVSRPIEEWGGMLAATVLLGTAAFLTSVFYRKFHAARAARKRSILSQDGTT